MNMIYVYTRDEAGIISYIGPSEGWNSIDSILAYYNLNAESADTEKLVGWPHDQVTWYGYLGLAS